MLRVLALFWLAVLLVGSTRARRHGANPRSLLAWPATAAGAESAEEKADPARQQFARHHRHRHHPALEGAGGSAESKRRAPEASGELPDLGAAPRHLLLERLGSRARARHLARHQTADDELGQQFEREQRLGELLWEHSRDKRHNRRRTWTAEDLKAYNDSRLKVAAQFEGEAAYEVEVREAQNSSLCNYTVIPIPDPGDRIPRQLEHIKCNHAGSRCQARGTYCCIQTYRHVEVVYLSGKKESLKVYSGCVCALQSYGVLEPYSPDVNIDD